jgi:hypothetical protein
MGFFYALNLPSQIADPNYTFRLLVRIFFDECIQLNYYIYPPTYTNLLSPSIWQTRTPISSYRFLQSTRRANTRNRKIHLIDFIVSW